MGRIPQVDGIERRKKEQQRGGTKEDKSLRGTTIKLVCVIPVIKTKHQSKRTQGNVRSPRVATRQINTAGHHKKRQAPTTETRVIEQKIITQPRKQQRE